MTLGLLAAVLVGYALGRVFSPSGAAGAIGGALEGREPANAEFEEAIALAHERLEEANYGEAYDLILVASRLAPSDPRLLEVLFSFVERAAAQENESSQQLAADLYARGEGLIAFQTPAAVSAARQSYDALGSKLEPDASDFEFDPFSAVRELLAAAQRNSATLRIRSLALEQARAELDRLHVSALADAAGNDLPESFRTHHSELATGIHAAETAVVRELFAAARKQADEWLAETDAILSECENASPQDLPQFNSRLKKHAENGSVLHRELSPYADSGVPGAYECAASVEERTAVLQWTRTWLYNQQVLRLIRGLEKRENTPVMEKIGHLAEVREEYLAPYVLSRHNEAWEKLWSELPTEEEQVKAVRLRILNRKE